MRFITTKDITTWADTIDCHYHLPQLIRKLIVATLDSTNIKKIHFPYGEDAQTGGYDGELIAECGNMIAPEGESVWEFGTTADKKKQKADDDYNKRKLNTLGKNPSKNTYIAINGYKYRDKEEWVNTKKAEGFWKDVRYLDAIDINQWLELAPTVELWLAERLGTSTLGIMTIRYLYQLI